MITEGGLGLGLFLAVIDQDLSSEQLKGVPALGDYVVVPE